MSSEPMTFSTQYTTSAVAEFHPPMAKPAIGTALIKMALPTLAGNHGFCRGKAAGSSQIKPIYEPVALPLHCDSRLIWESRKDFRLVQGRT